LESFDFLIPRPGGRRRRESNWGSPYVSEARTVLVHAPALAEKVRDGFTLNEAYEIARPQALRAVCQAGRVLICFPPHALHLSRRPASGTNVVSGNASTFTSALCPQASHAAMTARTPFSRMFASVIGGPKFLRTAGLGKGF
jgi:hypothetical protein